MPSVALASLSDAAADAMPSSMADSSFSPFYAPQSTPAQNASPAPTLPLM